MAFTTTTTAAAAAPEDDLYSAGDAAESPASHPTVPSVAARVDEFYDSADRHGTLLLLPPATVAAATTATGAIEYDNGSSQPRQDSSSDHHHTGPSYSAGGTTFFGVNMSKPLGKLATDIVSGFVSKLRTEFRDGTFIPKAYKERAEALCAAATLASTASPPAASPAVAVAPGVLPSITNVVEPGHAFPLYPWMKFAVILYRDAAQGALDSAGKAVAEDDPEALTAALGRAVDSLLDNTTYAISDLAGCVSRTCYLSREYTNALLDTVVRPTLSDLVSDRVMPRLRYAASIAVREPQPQGDGGAGDVTSPSLRSVLVSAMETLCIGWLGAWYPYLLHAVRNGRENLLLALVAPPPPATTAATAASTHYHQPRVHPVMALLYASEWIATVRRAATRRDRFADTQDGVYPNTVLVPTWWIDDVVRWLEMQANPESNPSSSSPPMPIAPTWKLVSLDSSVPCLTFEPRRRSSDHSHNLHYGHTSAAAFLPDAAFNVLWEMFGGGPKITVANKRCAEHLLRLQSLPEPAVAVQLVVHGPLLQRIIPERLRPPQSTTRAVDPLYEADEDSHVAAHLQLPKLTLSEIRVPLYATVWDVTLQLLAQVPRIASALQLDDATSEALRRAILYGHYSVSAEVVSVAGDAAQMSVAPRAIDGERRGAKQHVVDMNVAVGTYLLTTSLVEQKMVLCVDDAQFAFSTVADPAAAAGSVGKCGLVNLGNTCFMNSGLQCLSNLPLFRVEVLADASSLRQPPHCTPLLTAFTGLIRELWAVPASSSSSSYHYHGHVVNPTKFKAAIGRQCARFSGYEQQDAIEFIEVLLDRLHDELNTVEKKRFRERTDADNGIDVATLSKLYWADFLENNNSWVTRMCYRQEKTRFQCLECNFSSTVFDAQGSLSVPITEESYYSIDVPVFICSDFAQSPLEEEVDAAVTTTNHASVLPPRPLMVRVRIPQDSQMTVILVELRRLLSEAGLIGKTEEEQGEASLYYRFATGNGNWMLAAATSPSVAKILANYSYRCYVLRSFQRVARSNNNNNNSTAGAGAAAAATTTTVPTSEESESVSGSGVSNSRRGSGTAEPAPLTRVAFFVHDGTELSANGFTFRSSSTIPVDNRFVEMIHVQCFPRTGTTNREVLGVAKRVFAAYCRPVQRGGNGTTAGGGGLGEDESVQPNIRSEQPPLASSEGSQKETATSTQPLLVNEEAGEQAASQSQDGAASFATDKQEGEVVERSFSVHVVKAATTTERDSDPPLLADDELFPFPTHSYSEMIPMKVIVRVNPSRFSKPQPMEPVLHDTMRTVMSNEESLERARAEGGLTLMKCLRNLRERHVLKGDDAWYCPSCKAHKESITDSSQFILPDLLTVHLKRFKANAFGGLTKIETVVQFPLELDARGLLADELSHGDVSTVSESDAAGATTPMSCEYFLRGVVYHSGSLAFGHYTARAFCDGTGEWVHYNDSQATSAITPHPEQAYILFYQRRQPGEVMPAAYYRGSASVPDLIRSGDSASAPAGRFDSINSLD